MSHKYSVKPKKVELAKAREKMLTALIEGNQLEATQLVDSAIVDRWEPSSVYVNVIGHCMAEIGARWRSGRLLISTEHRATQIALRLISRAQSSYVNSRRVGLRAIVTSVEGDTHLIGGLTFADLLRVEGWEVDFLGADSPTDSIVEIVQRESPDLVGLSVTIEDYLPNAIETLAAIKELPNPPVVVIGGVVLLENSVVEADFSSTNAVEAVEWVQTRFNLNASSQNVEVMLAELGNRIKELRKDKGLSQQQLATEADLDRSYISAVENGKQNVSFATIKGISDALGIGLSDLISG
ncbi:MAG: cobalamin-dependent protein [Nitrospinaceae bacterium]|jgi:methanogenic corrinoid protein MtbC1/DNA-binding XRE family transcriptional regulator|tara:strand:+ start:270 stop:1157 length:888 start_codon:yes stop_codon:yes gene_type:complete